MTTVLYSKSDKLIRKVSTLKNDDLAFLYQLIPALEDQNFELQTKVQELAEILITRIELPLSKIIDYYKQSYVVQNFSIDQNRIIVTSPFYSLKQSKKVSRYYPTYEKQGSKLISHNWHIENKKELEQEIITNYVNKIEQCNDVRNKKLLFRLNDTRGLLFAQYVYKAIHNLITGNLYAIVESRAFISSLFFDNIQDDFCNFEKLENLITNILKNSSKNCHNAGAYIEHILYRLQNKEIISNVIPKDRRALNYVRLKEWQILYDFFKPYKDIYRKLDELQKFFNYRFNEDYEKFVNKQEPNEEDYQCSNYSEDYLDFISFIITQEEITADDDLPFIDDEIRENLINNFRELYFNNIDLFSYDFISSNQFVESFNTVATCLFEFVFNKDIERFFC